MNRRRFFSALAAGVAGLTLPSDNGLLSGGIDPERLLWTPGKVKVFDLGAMPKALNDREVGIAIRFLREWDIRESRRLDVLFGWAVLRPEYAERIVRVVG